MPRRGKRQMLVEALLAWYGQSGRDLPWRVRGARHPDPYHVLLSEVMLQQTTVAAVIPYFAAFLRKWPDVCALAGAEDGEVMQAWAGLGYYARARNLLKAAREVCHSCGGVFPASSADLQRLPGIGPYTAAAVAAIAFDEPVLPVDANIARVIARLEAFDTPLPGGMNALRALAQEYVPSHGAGDVCQAMMDLGSSLCSPKNPRCGECPLRPFCKAAKDGTMEQLPVKAAKKARPVEHGVFYILMDGAGRIALRRRPARGIWGGLMEVPSSGWRGAHPLPAGFGDGVDWEDAGHLSHIFTHFALEMEWRLGAVSGSCPGSFVFLPWKEAVLAGVPSPIAKALKNILGRSSS